MSIVERGQPGERLFELRSLINENRAVWALGVFSLLSFLFLVLRQIKNPLVLFVQSQVTQVTTQIFGAVIAAFWLLIFFEEQKTRTNFLSIIAPRILESFAKAFNEMADMNPNYSKKRIKKQILIATKAVEDLSGAIDSAMPYLGNRAYRQLACVCQFWLTYVRHFEEYRKDQVPRIYFQFLNAESEKLFRNLTAIGFQRSDLPYVLTPYPWASGIRTKLIFDAALNEWRERPIAKKLFEIYGIELDHPLSLARR